MICSVALACVMSQVGPPRPETVIQAVPTANDALLLAEADCKALPAHIQPYQLYVWIRSGKIQDARAVSFAVNTISRAAVINRPATLKRGDLLVVRMDLRAYAPRNADMREWLKIREDFQYDPAFSLLITPGTLKATHLLFGDLKGKAHFLAWEEREVQPYVEDGQTYTRRWFRVRKHKEYNLAELKADEFALLRLPGPDLDPLAYSSLAEMTHSEAPIISDQYFLFRALSTIKDDGLYAEVYGGRYYDLAGIPNTLSALFTDLGIDEKTLERLRGDQRAARFRSDVTAGPRRGDFFRHQGTRPDVGQGLFTLTHDLKRKSIDIDQHPLANLLKLKVDASESIHERANGLHGYGLWDGNGKRQDKAPDDVAKDHTVPPPHHGELQCAISCMSCHEADGSDGWKAFPNEVRQLLKSGRGLDIFGDLGIKDSADATDRIAGLYAADPEPVLIRARNDYAAAVLRATGPWPESKDQTDVVKLTASQVVSIWRGYWHELVDHRQAAQELGISGVDREAFNKLLPPDRRLTVQNENGEDIALEDPRIAALKAGLKISRTDWDLVRGFAAERAAPAMAKMRNKEKVKQ